MINENMKNICNFLHTSNVVFSEKRFSRNNFRRKKITPNQMESLSSGPTTTTSLYCYLDKAFMGDTLSEDKNIKALIFS
jgi:hypothetical protein